MNLQKLTDEILRGGGATYSLTYGSLAGTKGYAVSIYKDREERIPIGEFNETELRNYIHTNSDLLSDNTNCIGAWVEAGEVWLDVVVREKSVMKARELAKANNQTAIYSLETGETLYL